jgi:hypothetical protein
MGRDPGIGQESAKPIGELRRQTLQDILEVRVRIDLMPIAASRQAVRGRRRPAAMVGDRTPLEQFFDGIS